MNQITVQDVQRCDAMQVVRMSQARGMRDGKGYSLSLVSKVLRGERQSEPILSLHRELVALRTSAHQTTAMPAVDANRQKDTPPACHDDQLPPLGQCVHLCTSGGREYAVMSDESSEMLRLAYTPHVSDLILEHDKWRDAHAPKFNHQTKRVEFAVTAIRRLESSNAELTNKLEREKLENERLKAVLDDATKSLSELVDRGNENTRLAEELEGQHELNARLRKDLLAANDEAYRLGKLLAIIRKTAKLAKA
ncbi:MAG TPA: hypothetical protein PKD45_15550 [Flavobacteriales bacterium]|nr:hypothetical protein [Flavobacteriales bacterium]